MVAEAAVGVADGLEGFEVGDVFLVAQEGVGAGAHGEVDGRAVDVFDEVAEIDEGAGGRGVETLEVGAGVVLGGADGEAAGAGAIGGEGDDAFPDVLPGSLMAVSNSRVSALGLMT